ncbi:hypothetical protein EIP91_011820 [Steccherinum ochraceum]|uniref:Uncharacterized protein n=1 Tax=Steccherinum ochraceum TaxID=92696 RepID=A0A4R0RK42_9APHY|nr:hypothetical protein EIP91_011820 [Steccherinum ochraceum]
MDLNYLEIQHWHKELVNILGLTQIKDANPDALAKIKHAKENIASCTRSKGLAPIFAQIVTSKYVRTPTRVDAANALAKHIRLTWSPRFKEHEKHLAVHPKDKARLATIRCLLDDTCDEEDWSMRELVADILTLMLRASVGVEREQSLLKEILVIMRESRVNFKVLHCTTETLINFLSKEDSEEILLLVLPSLHDLPDVVLNRLKGSKAIFQADGPFRLLDLTMDQTGRPLKTPLARARLVSFFRACVDRAAELGYPRAVKKQMQDIVPKWVAVFKELLLDDPNKDVHEKCWDALYLKQAIFECLPGLIKSPFVSEKDIHTFLSCTLGHLTMLYPAFRETCVDGTARSPEITDHVNPAEVSDAMRPALTFFVSALQADRGQGWFDEKHVKSIVDVAFKWAQLSRKEELEPKLFVQGIRKRSTTRDYAADTLNALLENSRTRSVTANAIVAATSNAELANREISVSARPRSDWWRPLEASLGLLCELAYFFCSSAGRQHMHFEQLFQYQDIARRCSAQLPYVDATARLLMARYAPLLPDNHRNASLEGTVLSLKDDAATMPIKFSALRALQYFYKDAPQSDTLSSRASSAEAAIRPYATQDNGLRPVALAAMEAIESYECSSRLSTQMRGLRF